MITVNLTAASWTGTAAPYTQVAQAVGIAATDEVLLHPYQGATQAQRAAARAAELYLTDNGDGSVTIVADGTKPTIEVLLDSRVEDIEAELQSEGSYISKYSGEEIDELLDKVSAT